jgi:hypothetical protein
LQQWEQKNNGYPNKRENDAERNKADRQARHDLLNFFVRRFQQMWALVSLPRRKCMPFEPLQGQRKLQ